MNSDPAGPASGRGFEALALVGLSTWLLLAGGCSSLRMAVEPPLPSCRTRVPADAPPVRWMSAFDADDRRNLHAWCEAVGPLARHDPQGVAARADGPIAIVSWNMAVGAGRLRELLRTVRGSAGPSQQARVILMIQEAYRATQLPAECPRHSGLADRIAPARTEGADIMELAADLGLYAVYVPSMRNGQDCLAEPLEDRGNAILSDWPLSDVVAIELPFAQQRRVAVAATVALGSQSLHVVSVHFDTLLGHKRQATGLWKAIDVLGWRAAVVIGGDFNAHPIDPGMREMKKHFTDVDCGTGPTHVTGRRLDHLFVRGVDDVSNCETGPDRLGSDHHPLIASFRRSLPTDH